MAESCAEGCLTSVHRGTNRWVLLVLVFVLSLPAITPRLYASDAIE